MEKIVTKVMDDIAEECREMGFYPDLVELEKMAMVRLNQRQDVVGREPSPVEIPWQ